MVKSAVKNLIRSNPQVIEGYQQLGSLVYFGEALPLQLIHRLVKGTPLPNPEQEYFQRAVTEVNRLFKEDARRISAGDYPLDVLGLPKPRTHLKRLSKLYLDAMQISWRRRFNKSKEFNDEARQHFEDVPEYYRRNFHHQTNGYLSEESADLYDHQVDILFRGTAQAMRRMILWGLRDQGQIDGRGEGLRLLELACGNGSATVDIARALPGAQITSLDLSAPYLNKAKRKLDRFPKVSLLQGNAANLDFKDGTFDAVVSVFLFHELPYEVRVQVLQEARRVVKPGGYVGMVDSIQMDDVPEFNSGLVNFPKEFHEPFYKNYVNHPMDEIFHKAGLRDIKTELGFVSKLVGSKKV